MNGNSQGKLVCNLKGGFGKIFVNISVVRIFSFCIGVIAFQAFYPRVVYKLQYFVVALLRPYKKRTEEILM